MTGRTFCSPLCCAYGKDFAACGKAQHMAAVRVSCAAHGGSPGKLCSRTGIHRKNTDKMQRIHNQRI